MKRILLFLLSVFFCFALTSEARGDRSGRWRPYSPRRYPPQNAGRWEGQRPPLGRGRMDAVSSPNMTKRRFTGRSGTLQYCQFAENMNGSGSPSLLLVLHGRSGSGSDNTSQLSSPALRSLIPYLNRHAGKVIVLAPQCPSGQDWTGGRGGTSLLPVLNELVREKCREFNISPGKCGITGISMGGGACYTFMAQYPGLFAKAIVVCAACRENDSARLNGNFYIIHGENDQLIPAERARQTAQSISQKGNAQVKFTCLPGKDHISCAENAYTEACWKWMFQ